METEEKSNGALIGLIVITILLIIGGIYIWREKNKQIEIIKIQNAKVLEEQASIIKLLEQDVKNTETNVGVDVNTIN
ncbi:MAG: hypothetical protein WCP17_02715 [bacterium]